LISSCGFLRDQGKDYLRWYSLLEKAHVAEFRRSRMSGSCAAPPYRIFFQQVVLLFLGRVLSPWLDAYGVPVGFHRINFISTPNKSARESSTAEPQQNQRSDSGRKMKTGKKGKKNNPPKKDRTLITKYHAYKKIRHVTP